METVNFANAADAVRVEIY